MPSPRARLPSGLVVLVALVALALPACSGGDDRLIVYSGRSDDLITPILRRFSDEAGVKIDVKYGDSAELALLIDEEGDKSPADVFISQSPGASATSTGRIDSSLCRKRCSAWSRGPTRPGTARGWGSRGGCASSSTTPT
ncbi:MAG: hypothetical protein WKF43_07115 [Acidimicrobiales bacterium]